MIETIKEYLPDILAVYGALVAISTIIVKYTPTKKDDEILSKIIKFLDDFLLVVFNKIKPCTKPQNIWNRQCTTFKPFWDICWLNYALAECSGATKLDRL